MHQSPCLYKNCNEVMILVAGCSGMCITWFVPLSSVGGNKITPDGARMLAEALNVNQSLTTLK